jgi:hypothetical protein
MYDPYDNNLTGKKEKEKAMVMDKVYSKDTEA